MIPRPHALTALLTTSFFEDCWQKEVWWSGALPTGEARIQPSAPPSRLISTGDIEYLLSSLEQVDRNWIQVVKMGKPLRAGAYLAPSGHVSLPLVYAAYRAGHTIQLAKIHKRWPAVGALCREVEVDCHRAGVALALRVGSHLYLTPPRSTGLEPHYDNHDVIVLQVEGTKRWRIYGALQEFPLGLQLEGVPREALPPLAHDVVLGPGDILYVPRGLFHEASTEAERSVHVTLDITPATWADLTMALMRRHPLLRQSLPLRSLDEGHASTLRQGSRERCEALAGADLELGSIGEAMFEHFFADVDLLPGRGLDQLDSLDALGLETRVQRRRGSLATVLHGASRPALALPGTRRPLAPELAEFLCALAEEAPLAVRDLPDADGARGALDKVEEARALIGCGFLERVDPQ